MRAVVWVEVSSDVSIYLGPRILNCDHMIIGRKTQKGGEVFVGYDEGTQITDPKILNNNKVSFHGSGITRAGGGRSFRTRLRDLRERQLLCYIILQHPTKFPILNKIEKYDICLNYPIEENSPIMCHVYVAPGENKLPPIIIRDAIYQASIILHYENIQAIGGDLAVQFLFFHGAEGAWPSSTYFIWQAKDENIKLLA